jgi:hypothetical protein
MSYNNAAQMLEALRQLEEMHNYFGDGTESHVKMHQVDNPDVDSFETDGGAISGKGNVVWPGIGSIPTPSPQPGQNSGGTPGSSIIWTGSITGGAQGGSSGFTVTGVPASTPLFSLTAAVVKTSVRYVIVKLDNSCLELEEQQPITPREMIGICKFLGVVSSVVTAGGSVKVNWSDFIANNKIERHFVSGKSSFLQYDHNTEVLYVLLHDSN